MNARLPRWVGVLLVLMVLAPVVAIVVALDAWARIAFPLLFILVYGGLLAGMAALYARWSPAASFREVSWQATALAAAVAGALAGLTAELAVSALGTLDVSLGESVSGGAVFALVWYGLGVWMRGEEEPDERGREGFS